MTLNAVEFWITATFSWTYCTLKLNDNRRLHEIFIYLDQCSKAFVCRKFLIKGINYICERRVFFYYKMRNILTILKTSKLLFLAWIYPPVVAVPWLDGVRRPSDPNGMCHVGGQDWGRRSGRASVLVWKIRPCTVQEKTIANYLPLKIRTKGVKNAGLRRRKGSARVFLSRVPGTWNRYSGAILISLLRQSLRKTIYFLGYDDDLMNEPKLAPVDEEKGTSNVNVVVCPVCPNRPPVKDLARHNSRYHQEKTAKGT